MKTSILVKITVFIFLLSLSIKTNCHATSLSNYKNIQDEISVQGKIIDASTNEVIPYCNISISNTYEGTSSNELGEFEIKVEALPVVLTFSHLNYEQLDITISNLDQDLIITLRPLVNVLEEVVLENKEPTNDRNASRLANRVYRNISSRLRDSTRFGRAFYRQKSTTNNEFTEFAEIFFDAQYGNGGITKWDILEGRYAIKEEGINNKNYTKLSQILRGFQPDTEDVIFPFHPELETYYNVTIKDVFNNGGNEITILRFSPKPDVIIPIFRGEAYVNAKSNQLLKLSGIILNDDVELVRLAERKAIKKNYQLAYDLVFKQDSKGELMFDHMKVDQKFDYFKGEVFYNHVSSTSNLVFYEHYTPETKKRLGRQFRRSNSDWENLDEIGYNKTFWEENPIVKRTPVENEVIDAFEKENAFESIFLNSQGQISLLQSKISSDSLIVEIDTALTKALRSSPIEKVYLHTDRNIYTIGDNLWFSAYSVIGPKHYYSASKMLQVNLVDKNNDLVLNQNYNLFEGTSKGLLRLPKTLATGTYELRAYTEGMLEQNQDFIFRKQIEVRSPFLDENPAVDTTTSVDIQFLPEGGSAVVGLTNRVAFRATNPDGTGVLVSGRILDSQGNQVAQFRGNDFGVGFFTLVPEENETYTAEVEGKEYPLPKILNEGYSLFVNNSTPNTIKIRVQASPGLRDKLFYIIGATRHLKYFQGRYNFRGRSFIDLEIPKNRFPSGITTITLFDEQIKPWSERAVFINQNDQLDVETEVKLEAFKDDGEVQIGIFVKDQSGNPVSTNLSLAATNFDRVQKQEAQSNIVSYLMLESDIQGYIHNPMNYIKQESRLNNYVLDLIMLTQGWRQFEWQKYLVDDRDTMDNQLIDEGYKITGKASDKDNKSLENTTLNLIAQNDGGFKIFTTETDDTGAFIFNNMKMEGELNLTFKAYDKRRKPLDVNITLDNNNPIDRTPKFGIQIWKNGSQSSAKEFYESVYKADSTSLSFEGVTKLEEVELEGTAPKKKRPDEHFLIEPDQTIYPKQGDFSLMQLLDKANGVTVTGFESVPKVRLRGQGNPLWVIDGIAIDPTDPFTGQPIELSTLQSFGTATYAPSQVVSLDVNSIDRIEFLLGSKAAIYGNRANSGVILIYTKRGQSSPAEEVNSPQITYKGIVFEKEFYRPKYVVETKDADHTTLYWNSSIITDEEGKAQVTITGLKEIENLQIAIEGLSFTGIPGYSIEVLENLVTNGNK